jgi:thioesterase domain-containing protein
MTPLELQNQLEKEIPITKALGFKVHSLSNEKAECSLPLTPNINHKSTLFGGSQYSGCALACYSLFLFNVRGLKEATNNIVVSGAEISYKHPAKADVKIVATWIDQSERAHFLESLERKGKARVGLLARVTDQSDLLLSEFRGHFVVFLK